MKHFGHIDPAIMLGEKRSAFSPAVNRRSIDALKKGHFADEDPPERHIVAAADNNDSSESGDVPALTQAQTEEATAPDNPANELTANTVIDMDDLSTLLPLSSEPE